MIDGGTHPNNLRATRKKKYTCFLIIGDFVLGVFAMQLDAMAASVDRPDAVLRRLLGRYVYLHDAHDDSTSL